MLRLCSEILFALALLAGGSGTCLADSATAEYRSELIFPLHDQHNHAPAIAELADGDLIVSWYRGSGERTADDVAVWGARKPSDEDVWSEPFVMADTLGFPDCNTALLTDAEGRLLLFWPVIIANSWESCLTRVRISDAPSGTGCPKWDHNDVVLLKPADFSAEALKHLDAMLAQLPRPLTEREAAEVADNRLKLGQKLYQRLGWQPRCKPTVLPSGRILLPLYTDTFSISMMAISDDGGATWFASQALLGFGAIQPSVLRRSDGTVVAYMRENGFTGKVRTSESADDGETWGPVGTIDLPNPGSGLDGLRLRSGVWILVHNDATDGRQRLAISRSDDEGRTWRHANYLENHESGAYHYPSVIQTRDGLIHVVYSYFVDGGKSMKHAAFAESWLNGDQ